MVFSINGLTREFAVSSGNNIHTTEGTSDFDCPPRITTDLVITADADDKDPREFELGESYDLTWLKNGEGFEMMNAEVVRSDLAPDGLSGLVVFEGFDFNGVLTQIVWTPEFDLEDWYYANFEGNEAPGFYHDDVEASYTYTYVCFAAETLIGTPHGPMPAGDICPGDRVDTLDHGWQTVRWAGRVSVPGYGEAAPVRFAPGAIGNAEPLRLSANHRVLLRSDRAELMYGFSEVLVPAKALVNGTTIRLAPCPQVTYVHFLFDNHEILMADGALCESLLMGEQARKVIGAAHQGTDPDLCLIQSLPDGAEGSAVPARPVLSVQETRALLEMPRLRGRRAVPAL